MSPSNYGTEKEKILFDIPTLHFAMRALDMKAGVNYRGMHMHTAVEIVRVDYGNLEVTFSSEKVLLLRGQTLLIPGRVPHKLSASTGAGIRYIQIGLDGYFYDKANTARAILAEFAAKPTSKSYIISNSGSEAARIFDHISHEAVTKEAAYADYIKAYGALCAAYMKRSGIFTSGDDPKLDRLVPVAEFVDRNYRQKLTIDELAEAAGCGRFALCRLFTALTGQTAVDFMNFVRLKKADEMLLVGDLNVSEVAFECGFSTVQYFNRVFKDSRGFPPGELKRSGK